MKTAITGLFVFFSIFLSGQTEQLSLDFFSEKLLPQKKIKVFYDSKIVDKTIFEAPKVNDEEETAIENILWDYSMVKDNRKGLSGKQTEFSKDFDYQKISAFANVKNSIQKNLEIPKNIKFRQELKTKKRKSGNFRYKINHLSIQKYNLKISPSIQIGENTYLTRIYLTKQDNGEGSYFDIIAKDGKVIDWTETGWKQ